MVEASLTGPNAPLVCPVRIGWSRYGRGKRAGSVGDRVAPHQRYRAA